MPSSLDQEPDDIQSSLNWLEKYTRLPAKQSKNLAKTALALCKQLHASQAKSIALAGPPGSGKSTLARLVDHILNESGVSCVTLSLDDYYFDLHDRQKLAKNTHHLLTQRGPPGTHDWAKLMHDFDHLNGHSKAGIALPAFNKSTDDRRPETEWRFIDFKPSVIMVEGWCLGTPPQQPKALNMPANNMEQEHDPHGNWRHYVNMNLSTYHQDLRSRMDQFWCLRVPNWDCVIDWRWQQELELPRAHLESREEVAGFLSSFERLVDHMQETCIEWADTLIQADQSHFLERIK